MTVLAFTYIDSQVPIPPVLVLLVVIHVLLAPISRRLVASHVGARALQVFTLVGVQPHVAVVLLEPTR